MIYRVGACIIGTGMVLFGACDHEVVIPEPTRLVTSTIAESPISTTAAPSTTSTTLVVEGSSVAPRPTTEPHTPETVAATAVLSSKPNFGGVIHHEPSPSMDVTDRLYQMYERSPEIVQLQMLLGLKSVDGIYGPVTRKAHIEHLGGPLAALAVFHPEIANPVPVSDTTLGELINRYFLPGDRAWARQVAFCESSAQTYDTESAVVASALAVGWFQHLAKFWSERSEKAGVSGASPFDTEANVAVAAWLLYEGGGTRHWNPSRTCWEDE